MAEVTIPDKTIYDETLDKLIAYYPKVDYENSRSGMGENPSSWIVWNNATGKLQLHLGEICHASMYYGHGSVQPDEMITACPNSSELALQYQRMLIHGPFQAFAEHIALKQRGKHYYIHITGLDKFPANVLFNYCIATRVPIEHVSLLTHFGELLEKDVHPSLSFLVSWSKNGDAKTVAQPRHLNHFWLDNNADWENVLRGTIKDPSKNYKFNPAQVRPCNIIWGALPQDDLRKLFALSVEELNERFGLVVKRADPLQQPVRIRKPSKSIFNQIYAQAMEAQDLAVPQAVGAQPPQWAGFDIEAGGLGAVPAFAPNQIVQPAGGEPGMIVMQNGANNAWQIFNHNWAAAPQPAVGNVHDDVMIDLAEDDDDLDDLDDFEDDFPEDHIDDDF